IKWDGFRALCYVENGKYRLIGRRKTDFTAQFPELAPLSKLPDGCIVDGEIVAMVNGKPEFTALMDRKRKVKTKSRHPVTFIGFDLLYLNFESIQKFTCEQRREGLDQLIESVNSPRLVMSRSIIGDGKAYYDQAKAMGLEGIVAKKRNSP